MRSREIERFQRAIDRARDVADGILADDWSGDPPQPTDRAKLRQIARQLVRKTNQLEKFLIAEISKTPSKRKQPCPERTVI